MITNLTFDGISPEMVKTNGKANGWDTLDIYSNGKLIERVPLSKIDSSGKVEVLIEDCPDGILTARYSITIPSATPKLLKDDKGKEVKIEEIKPETFSGSLDHIRKSLGKSHDDQNCH